MSQSPSGNRLHLGFLRIVPVDTGFVGGLLVTNRLGRPLEFQCTTPVTANRTQQILYGPTLKPFLFGELIGRTLLERVQVKPDLILIDQPELLDLRTQISTPLACLSAETAGDPQPPDETHVPPPTDTRPPGAQPQEQTASQGRGEFSEQRHFSLGGQALLFHHDFTADAAAVKAQMSRLPTDADLHEPLARVEEALRETVRPGAVA